MHLVGYIITKYEIACFHVFCHYGTIQIQAGSRRKNAHTTFINVDICPKYI
jgi:hypothetical protein